MPAAMRAITKILPPLSQEQNDQFWLQATRAALDATPAFGLLAVPDNKNNELRVRGGRLYQRMHLWTATQGLAMQPVNYTSERADREESLGIEPEFGDGLRALIDNPAWQPLMTFSRVLFPLPLRPRMAANSPLAKLALIPCRTGRV